MNEWLPTSLNTGVLEENKWGSQLYSTQNDSVLEKNECFLTLFDSNRLRDGQE